MSPPETSQPSKADMRASTKDLDMTKSRTPRACDRCRLKKAKCDGTSPCKTCKSSESGCTYATRRGREARNYYWHLREVTDEALQRLYWACRRNQGFPGIPPEESGNPVTTNAILEALGLIGPTTDELGLPQQLLDGACKRRKQTNSSMKIGQRNTPTIPSTSTSKSSPAVDRASPCSSHSTVWSLSEESGAQDVPVQELPTPSRPQLAPQNMAEQFSFAIVHQDQRLNQQIPSRSVPTLTNTDGTYIAPNMWNFAQRPVDTNSHHPNESPVEFGPHPVGTSTFAGHFEAAHQSPDRHIDLWSAPYLMAYHDYVQSLDGRSRLV